MRKTWTGIKKESEYTNKRKKTQTGRQTRKQREKE